MSTRAAGVILATSVLFSLMFTEAPFAHSKDLTSGKARTLRFSFPKKSVGSMALVTSESLAFGETSWHDTIACIGDVTLPVKDDENVMLTPDPAVLANVKLLDSSIERQIDGIRVKYVPADGPEHGGDIILAQLAILKNLKYLILTRADIADAGFDNLGKMESLVRLDVSSTGVTGRFLSLWKNFPKLSTLELSNCPINSEQLNNLQHFPDLKSLDVRNVRLTAAAIGYLSRCSRLEQLYLAENKNINNQSLTTLRQLSQLKVLDLNATSVTKEGLASLKSLPLTRLTLSHSFIADKAELQKILPRCGLVFARDKQKVDRDVLNIFAPLK